MTKLWYMIKNFEIDVEKVLSKLSLGKVFAVLVFKYDISDYSNNMSVFSVPSLLQ